MRMPPWTHAMPVVGLTLIAALVARPATPRTREARSPEWRTLIEDRDRDRLRVWRQAWLDGLAAARAGGAAQAITAEGALLGPDAAQESPALPEGDYRCRAIKLGTLPGALNPPFVSLAAVPCSVRAGRLRVSGGGQRPAGWLWPFDKTRLLFLGAMALGDERAVIPYGRDRERNLAGFVERIGDRQWRLVLPHPQWEALIEVIELTPAPPTAGGA